MARTAVPADGLLHPVALAAIAVLVLNDHWWKEAFASAWTGKVSDFAGMLFFPLFLQAGLEVASSLARRPFRPSRRVLVGAALLTGLVFGLVQVWTPMTIVYAEGLGMLQWPFRAAGALATGEALPGVLPVRVTPDPTDLIALPALLGAVAAGWRRCAVTPSRTT